MDGKARGDAILDVRRLSMSYRSGSFVDATRNVFVALGRERLGIVGESGSGKSTVGRAPATPAHGAHRRRPHALQELDLLDLTGRQMLDVRGRRMSMILQDPKFLLNPIRCVGDQVAEACCDEIWAFCYAKGKNVPTAKAAPEDAGDGWTWTALDPDSKLMVSNAVGDRDAQTAYDFMFDLADRLAGRVQLTTDGFGAYLKAVTDAFPGDVDYARLIKLFGEPTGTRGHERKYSPAECSGIIKEPVFGKPDPEKISTSHVERQNLNMRMGMRRFTRLTNGFSKKVESHAAMVALYTMFYNFCRVHETLRVTPAMEAGLTDHVWDMDEVVAVMDERAPKPGRPKTHRKREPGISK